MERRGGCCIAMYGGGGGGDADVAWKMGRIMLRFRPIAPKPAGGSPAVASAPPEASPGARRTKRKGSANPSAGARGRKTRKVEAKSPPSKDDGKSLSSSSSSTTTTSTSTIVTLPLMPETPERKDDTAGTPPKKSPTSPPPPPPAPAVVPCVVPAWMRRGEGSEEAGAAAGLVAPRAVGSWVTVECVTETWREGEVAWRSDGAVGAALAADECPGFVSDERCRVTWANKAYRRMVVGCSSEGGGGVGGVEEEVRVGLVTRGLVPAAEACRAFTCRVRVRYARGPSSLAAPCDVWRLDGGGCAWRLDVKAALSLSL